MSKHNYSQYSNKKKTNYDRPQTPIEEVEAVTTVSAPAEPAEIKMEYETPVEHVYVNETVEAPKPFRKRTSGTVIGCNRLNVRANPDGDSDIAAVIIRDSEVNIDLVDSTKEWFKVTTTAGVEGYCMRKFVSAKL